MKTTTIIIGAGQNGLAMSAELTRAGVDHVVLERGKPGQSWRSDRWDSLRLLSPNWMNDLAGAPCRADRDGFMPVAELICQFDRAAAASTAPILRETRVLSVRQNDTGYLVQTTQGLMKARSVVMANGACAKSKIPQYATEVPGSVRQLTPLTYKRPGDVPEGRVLVVGASASGQQIARELQAAGREVTLAVGSHLRLPRRYRGADILHWMTGLGLFDELYNVVDDLQRVRRTPSLTLTGGHDDLDLNVLQAMGVEITGRMAAIRDGKALFSGGLHNVCQAADLKLGRLLDEIDGMLGGKGDRPTPTVVPDAPRLSLGLDGIGCIIWATGFTPDFSWLHMPVFDRKGRLQHDGGLVAPGLYAMGQPFLRTRASTHIHGAQSDAHALSQHLISGLETRNAA